MYANSKSRLLRFLTFYLELTGLQIIFRSFFKKQKTPQTF